MTRLQRFRRFPRAVVFSACLCSLGSLPAAAREAAETRPPGDRSISLQARVRGTPEEIFATWTRADRVDQFFGSGAEALEAREGGLYEIRFGVLPDGRVGGPRGNRILRWDPPTTLAFEWTMPAFAEHLNTTPLPTWVEVRFEEFGDAGDSTLVRLEHHGFGEGPDWDRCFGFFQRGWFDILFRLRLHREFFVWSSR